MKELFAKLGKATPKHSWVPWVEFNGVSIIFLNDLFTIEEQGPAHDAKMQKCVVNSANHCQNCLNLFFQKFSASQRQLPGTAEGGMAHSADIMSDDARGKSIKDVTPIFQF